MMLRPEVLGVIGLAVAALASLAIWFRLPIKASDVRPAVCIHCGTAQHNLSRTAALAHQIMGSDTCISCGEKLGGRR
jgi:hypothetical protein